MDLCQNSYRIIFKVVVDFIRGFMPKLHRNQIQTVTVIVYQMRGFMHMFT